MTKLLRQKKRFQIQTNNNAFEFQINAIAYHNSYIYVTGLITENLTIPGTFELGNDVRVTTPNGHEQMFVAKFNHQLVAQNARLITTDGDSQGFGIAVNNYGIYITGELHHDPNDDGSGGSTVDFGNDVRVTTPNGHEQMFVAKFNHQLVAQNARVITTDRDSKGRGIAVNNYGVYITGYLDTGLGAGGGATVDFENNVRVTTQNGLTQIFVAKFNHNLVSQNARLITTDKDSEGYGIAVNNYGVYITGFLDTGNEAGDGSGGSTVDFGNHVRVTTQNGSQQLFVAKFNHQLVAQNARVFTSDGFSNGHAIAINNDSVYITGGLQHDPADDNSGGTVNFGNGITVTTQNGKTQVFVAKFNHQLVAQNARVITSDLSSEANAIAVNNYGVYITGEISHNGGVIDFGNGHRIEQINERQDIFIVKYNHHLETQAVEVVQSDYNNGEGRGIALSNNSVYVCGDDNDVGLFKYSLCNHITQ